MKKEKKKEWIELAQMIVGIYTYLIMFFGGLLGFVGGLILISAGALFSSKLVIFFGAGALMSSIMATMSCSYLYIKLFIDAEEKNGNKSK